MRGQSEALWPSDKANREKYTINYCAFQNAKIKTHDSESRGQEEAGRMRRMSVLFTGNTGVKFVNTLNKPPLQLSISYQGPSTF